MRACGPASPPRPGLRRSRSAARRSPPSAATTRSARSPPASLRWTAPAVSSSPASSIRHVHFLDGGFRLASVQLRDAKTREEFVESHQGVRRDGAGRHLDHRRRLGSQSVGRRAAAARLDRCRDAEPSRVGQSPRRAHGAREQRRPEGRGGHPRDEGHRRRRDRSSSRMASPPGVLKDNAMALVDKVVPPPSDDMRARSRSRRR